jgi:E3 ubiquitin-protein ligase RGLG
MYRSFPDGQIEGPQERATVDAIVNASYYPLSIVLVGVGDGPWNMMRSFDDNLPARTFDNFQFVNFTEIMRSSHSMERKEAQFALAALMEVPLQYKATVELRIISTQRGRSPGVQPLPPPPKVLQMDMSQPYGRPQAPPPGMGMDHVQSYGYPSAPQAPPIPASGNFYPPPASNAYGDNGYYPPNPPIPAAASFPTARAAEDEGMADCPVCLLDKKGTVFNCGHQTCHQCSLSLMNCPICRAPITTRIRLN